MCFPTNGALIMNVFVSRSKSRLLSNPVESVEIIVEDVNQPVVCRATDSEFEKRPLPSPRSVTRTCCKGPNGVEWPSGENASCVRPTDFCSKKTDWLLSINKIRSLFRII